MKLLGRILLGAMYLAIPIVGWYWLARSFHYVPSGSISIINSLDGKTEIIEEGFYFRPEPGIGFGEVASKSADYIDFNSIKRIRVPEGYLGVKTKSDGKFETLEPGIHFINASLNETFDRTSGIQNINQDDFVLGNKRYITIRCGELGESYKQGKFFLLEAGRHELLSGHVFTKKVSVASDIFDLGAFIIITIKEGQVAIINTPEGVKTLGPGKHEIKQEEGHYFNQILTISPQGVTLPPLTVMCSDQIEMRAESMLIYTVTEPLKTVGLGISKIIEYLKDAADGTLRTILSRFNSSDIAPGLHTDETHTSTIRNEKLADIHNDLVKELNGLAQSWGLKVCDLKITQILPADKQYHDTIRALGTQQATAQANKQIADSEAAIALIKANAGESKYVAAQKEKKEIILRAQTDSERQEIEAQAYAKASEIKAQADANTIAVIAEAKNNRILNLNKATQDATPVMQQLLLTEAQGDILKQIERPVFVQPDLGASSFLTKESDGIRFFTTQKTGGPNSLVDLALQKVITQDVGVGSNVL